MRENLMFEQRIYRPINQFIFLFLLAELALVIIFQWFLKLDLPALIMALLIFVGILCNVLNRYQFNKSINKNNFFLFQLYLNGFLLTSLLLLSGKWVNGLAALVFPYLVICAVGITIFRLNKLVLLTIVSGLFLPLFIVLWNTEKKLALPYELIQASIISYFISILLILYIANLCCNKLFLNHLAMTEASSVSFSNKAESRFNNHFACVIHAIATPLSTIAIVAEELRSAAKDNADLKRYAQDFSLIEAQVKHCQTLILELNPKTLKPLSLPIDEWLPDFIQQWQIRHPQAQLKFLANRLPYFLVSNVDICGHILTIILDNAARASPLSIDLKISLKVKQLVFTIEDCGTGWPALLRSSLGKVPVVSQHYGSGIGLCLAFAMAKKINGEIKLEDAARQGAKVVFCLNNIKSEN